MLGGAAIRLQTIDQVNTSNVGQLKGAWDTGDIAPGGSASITFDSAGSYTFTCKPHPWMYGQVIVQ